MHTTIVDSLALLDFAGTETNVLIRGSDEGLTHEKSAPQISLRWPDYLTNSVDKTKHSFFLLDRVK